MRRCRCLEDFRAEDGKSFRVEDGKSFRAEDGESFRAEDGKSLSLMDGESKKREAYLGRMLFLKWLMYWSTQGRYVGSASVPSRYSASA